ncbi:hypothetical protein [Flavisolibacter tropicus]|uniref:Uncharacterized protein n=1 Tax=Flavisolibacter tropicus TaxID=1492898 RepID=A0A172TRF9_9BACT|nr:hypothetical protein [Flavisolibacter tropicus]ANE49669.1 hypothetical protein SY85_03295 [Flavisolibacter tropicus]
MSILLLSGTKLVPSAIPIRQFMTSLCTLTLSFFLTIYNPLTVLPPQPDSSKLPLTKSITGIFISNWEQVTSWEAIKNQETIQYSFKRLLSKQQIQLLSKSELVVFVKGYLFEDTSDSEKPLSLPFYFFTPDGNALKPLSWYYTTSSDHLVITFQAPLDMTEKLTKLKEKVQFCYFLLDKSYLKKKKLSPTALKNMSYKQLITFTAKTP